MNGMAPRMRRILLWVSPLVLLGACGAGVCAIDARLVPPTLPPPPLLAGVSAGFGNFSECSERAGGLVRACRPELERRLYQRFPAGSPEAPLAAGLAEQGFGAPTAFPNNPSVHFASYAPPPRDSGPPPASVYATVYWKVDDQGSIVWMHGYVSWLSL
jgi:hypothetical protein